jgi:hypothetical protein
VLTRGRIALALFLAFLALVIALAAGAFAWAKSYAPLRVTAYGPGFGVSERPVASSGDPCISVFPGCARLGFVVRAEGRGFAEFHVVVRNDGPWAITIERGDFHSFCGLPINADYCYALQELRQPPPRDADGNALTTRPFRPLRVPAHASADLWLRFQTSCRKHSSGYSSGFSAFPLVYRYLGHFERKQNVTSPFDIDFVC